MRVGSRQVFQQIGSKRALLPSVVITLFILANGVCGQESNDDTIVHKSGAVTSAPFKLCLSEDYSLAIETSSVEDLSVWFIDSKFESWKIWSSDDGVMVDGPKSSRKHPIQITLLDSDIRLALYVPGRSPIGMGDCRFVVVSRVQTRVTLTQLRGAHRNEPCMAHVVVSRKPDQSQAITLQSVGATNSSSSKRHAVSVAESAVILFECVNETDDSKFHVDRRRAAVAQQRIALQQIADGVAEYDEKPLSPFKVGLKFECDVSNVDIGDSMLSHYLVNAMYIYHKLDQVNARHSYQRMLDRLTRIRRERPTYLVLLIEVRVREAMYYHLHDMLGRTKLEAEMRSLLASYDILGRSPRLRVTGQLGSLIVRLEGLVGRVSGCSSCRSGIVEEAESFLEGFAIWKSSRSNEYLAKYLRAIDVVSEIHRRAQSFELGEAYALRLIEEARLARKVIGVGEAVRHESVACLRLADIAFEIGDVSGGMKWVEQSSRLSESLVGVGAVRRHTARMVASYVRMAELCRFLDDVDGMEEILGHVEEILEDSTARSELPLVTRWALWDQQSELMWLTGQYFRAVAIKEAGVSEMTRSLLANRDRLVWSQRQRMFNRLQEWLVVLGEQYFAEELGCEMVGELDEINVNPLGQCGCSNTVVDNWRVGPRAIQLNAKQADLDGHLSWPLVRNIFEARLSEAVQVGDFNEAMRLSVQLTESERRWALRNLDGLTPYQQHLLWQRGLRAEGVLVNCISRGIVSPTVVYELLRQRKGRGMSREGEDVACNVDMGGMACPGRVLHSFSDELWPRSGLDNGLAKLMGGESEVQLTDAVVVEVDMFRIVKDVVVPRKLQPICHYVAFVLLPDGTVRFVDLGDGEEIDQAVRKWRWEIQAGGDELATGKWLRERVWEPLEALFPPDVNRVYLCPDGELGLLPWNALPGKEENSVLLDQFTLALVPHAGWFHHQGAERQDKSQEPASSPGVQLAVTSPTRPPPQHAQEFDLANRPIWRGGGDGASLSPIGTSPTSMSDLAPIAARSRVSHPDTASRWLIVADVDYGGGQSRERPPEKRLNGVSPTGAKDPARLGRLETTEREKFQSRWSPLPHSRSERDTLAGYLPDSQRTELTGRQATRSRVLEELPQARWAHLATHGFHAGDDLRVPVGLENPEWLEGERRRQQVLLRRHPLLLTGLVLAGGNQITPPTRPGVPADPGPILTGDDVAQLSLDQLELVVLSSCESGTGEVLLGEGVFGLQRAFHLAGARNVVASLWQVDDEATAVLMKWFYYFLFEEQLSPVDSLRQAQQTLRRQGAAATLLAQSRGPNFRQRARQLVRQASPPSSQTAPTRLWAGFFLSGRGD